MDDFEVRDDRGSRAAGAALGVLLVLAVVMGVVMGALLAASLLSGCGSALADQCEALYARAQHSSETARTEEELAIAREQTAAADAACAPDGGAP